MCYIVSGAKELFFSDFVCTFIHIHTPFFFLLLFLSTTEVDRNKSKKILFILLITTTFSYPIVLLQTSSLVCSISGCNKVIDNLNGGTRYSVFAKVLLLGCLPNEWH